MFNGIDYYLQPFFLGFVPNGVHLGEGHIFEIATLLQSFVFEVVEAADKFLVGMLQGILGIDAVESGGIDEAEKEVAEFTLHILGIHMVDFGFQFVKLS